MNYVLNTLKLHLNISSLDRMKNFIFVRKKWLTKIDLNILNIINIVISQTRGQFKFYKGAL